VPLCCLQVFGTDLSRKKDVIGIVEKIAAVVLQDAPSPWFQAEALTSLCHWHLDSANYSGEINLRSPAAGCKGYEKI
jgi:hypothetical protein